MRSRLLILVFAALTTSSVMADCEVPKTPVAPETFFISGVMKKTNDGVTVRLVHSIARARSQQEALLVFAKNVAERYPNYVLADALILGGNSTTQSNAVTPIVGVEI